MCERKRESERDRGGSECKREIERKSKGGRTNEKKKGREIEKGDGGNGYERESKEW